MWLEPVFRQAEKEWKAFIEAFTDRIVEADPQIPPLPPKDVIHRIYRDVSQLGLSPNPRCSPPFTQVRFSNDKTPYKTNLSASFSRSGRKGIFAHCTSCLSPLFTRVNHSLDHMSVIPSFSA